MAKLGYLATDALLSDDGRYRYWLSRRLSMGELSVVFVGLNPSTADATEDDPTIRKCVGFARRWGFDWLYMANLHAFRSTDRKVLARMDALDAVGPANQDHLHRLMARADRVVAAWGSTPLNRYANQLAERVLIHPKCRALRLCKGGQPEHPLYVPYDVEPVWMASVQRAG